MEEEREKYINTEFGKVPSDWRYCTFKDVLITFSSGATPYRAIAEYYKGKIRWISSGELNYNVIYDTSEHISEAAVKNTNLKIHEPGTFLMAITGLEAEGTRGRCAIIGAPSTTNQSCLALNGTGKMTTDYLFWFYRQYGNYLAFKYCQGTKQQSYTAAIIKKLPICCPKDPNEQTAIATALSDTDALIAALNKKIAKKQQIKQGAMQQLLTGKKRLPGFGGENKYKETEIGLIPEDWGVIKVEEAFRFLSTASFSRDQLGSEGNVHCLHYGDIHTKYDEFIDFNFVVLPKVIGKRGLNYPLLLDGDIIMADASEDYTGLCKSVEIKNIGNKKVISGLHTILLRDRNNVFENGFKGYLFEINEVRKQLIELSTGMKVFGVSKKNLEQVFIPVPTKPEQTAIAQILTEMDQEIAQLERERDKYVQLKSGLMQVLLTGKVRLIKN
jgi:type I restriction enzyme S subunit